MAGTLIYRLQVDHIYQRRFGQAELAKALKNSHWYIVTRRPSVRVLESSASVDNQILTVDLITGSDLIGSRSVQTLGLDFGEAEYLANFRTYSGGAYFSIEIDGRLAHGDAWALASLLSGADHELAAQEVLYVGEAFGDNGSSNVWQRTRAHEKLQQIYEDHADVDCDIFVVPLSLERKAWTTDDHIDDDDRGPSFEKYYQHFATSEGAIRKPSVDLIEHSLISYFAPPYNEKLVEWRPSVPTRAMRLMREAGFRLIQVHLSGWWGLARFHSEMVPDRSRSHLISHDIPPEPRRPVFRGIAAERLSDWRHSAVMVREGQALLDEAAERTGVTIRVFGDRAPTLRTPPGVVLPSVPALEETTAAQAALRADIAKRREETRRAAAPIPHPGISTYEPETGTIVAGEREDGTVIRRRLRDPLTGKIDSTLVFGDAGSGRSNYLQVLLAEALMTGMFAPAVADVAAKGEWRRWFGSSDERLLLAEGVDESIRLLEALCRVIDDRAAVGSYHKPTSDSADILLVVDDADALLHDTRGAALVERILTEGGALGVGIGIVLGDIWAFEDRPRLMRALVAADSKSVYSARGDAVLKYLNAKYGSGRAETWGDDEGPLFVVHQDEDDAILGIATALLDARYDEAAAQALAIKFLGRLQRVLIDEWRQVGDDPRSWWSLDSNAKRWFIRRHDDVWLLVLAETNAPNVTGPDLIEWAEGQIQSRYEVDLGRWEVGPGTGAVGTEVLYVEVKSDISPKDRSEAVKRFIANLY